MQECVAKDLQPPKRLPWAHCDGIPREHAVLLAWRAKRKEGVKKGVKKGVKEGVKKGVKGDLQIMRGSRENGVWVLGLNGSNEEF